MVDPTPLRHTILLVGDARMAFPVSKALSQAGHKVHAGVSIYSNYLEWSKHVSASFHHPSLEPGTDDALQHYQQWLVEHPQIDTIQPVSEAGLRFLSRHRNWFANQAKLIMAPEAAIKMAHDKTTMFKLCEQEDIPVAPFANVTNYPETLNAVANISFPLIIKPSQVDAPVFGRKALIIKSQKDFDTLFPDWPDEHPELLVQRYIRGPRHSVIFSAQDGRLLGATQIRAARTHEADGTGYTTYGVTVEPDPIVKTSVERMVAALNYSSTGCIQFVIDPQNNAMTFMELNARVSLGRLAECAGLPHSVWGARIAHGEPVNGFADPWSTRRGIEYVWTKGELNLLGDMLKEGQLTMGGFLNRLGQTAWDAARCHHAIFDPMDVLPTIGVYSNKFISPFRQHLTASKA